MAPTFCRQFPAILVHGHAPLTLSRCCFLDPLVCSGSHEAYLCGSSSPLNGPCGVWRLEPGRSNAININQTGVEAKIGDQDRNEITIWWPALFSETLVSYLHDGHAYAAIEIFLSVHERPSPIMAHDYSAYWREMRFSLVKQKMISLGCLPICNWHLSLIKAHSQ